MRITLCLIALFFLSDLAIASDSTVVNPPVRMFYQDGRPIPEHVIPVVFDKDCDPNGWRFDDIEWEMLQNGRPQPPRQFTDPVKGSNGGVDWA